MSDRREPATVVALLPSFAGGGAERVTITLMNGLDRRLFRPVIVALDGSGPLRDRVEPDVLVHVLGSPRISRAMGEVVRTIRAMRPRAVLSTFAHLNLPLLAAKPFLGGARLVLREANLPRLNAERFAAPWLVRLGYAILYRHADIVLATSQRMCEELQSLGVPSSRTSLLPNPVDVPALRRDAQCPERLPGEGLRVVAVGRLTHEKGFDRLVTAFRTLPPNSRCLIFGEGPERGRLEERIAGVGLGERIELRGFVSRPGPWIAGADVLVMPSRLEGMPNAALEALALGTPVIATPEAGGLVELETGVTIAEAGTPLADAMRRAVVKESPGSSLLPARFEREVVLRQFCGLLAALPEYGAAT